MDNTEKSTPETQHKLTGRTDNIEIKSVENTSGDGNNNKSVDTSSTRWGQEGLSTKDCGQNPVKLRSLGERELSGFDDNTTTVGQPGDRKSLTLIDCLDNKHNSGRKQEESNK